MQVLLYQTRANRVSFKTNLSPVACWNCRVNIEVQICTWLFWHFSSEVFFFSWSRRERSLWSKWNHLVLLLKQSCKLTLVMVVLTLSLVLGFCSTMTGMFPWEKCPSSPTIARTCFNQKLHRKNIIKTMECGEVSYYWLFLSSASAKITSLILAVIWDACIWRFILLHACSVL